MTYTIGEGNYRNFGVTSEEASLIFTFRGEKEDACAILLYGRDYEVRERIFVPAEYCMGSVRSVRVTGLEEKHLVYNYEINGNIVTDPYARKIIGRERWADRTRARRDYRIYGGIDEATFDWDGDLHPEVPRSRMFLYKLHVRGFSMDAGLRGKSRGTFRAVTDKIPYLKSLGVTSVELMPVYEFEEFMIPKSSAKPLYVKWKSEEGDKIVPDPPKEEELKVNYWGYVPGNYFAVKSSYGSTKEASFELKELIRELHKNQMECILEMHFGDITEPDLLLEILRYWVREFHVDGFHLLGTPVSVTLASQDMFLSRTKIFADSFEPHLIEQSKRYPHLFLYNDEYLYPVRRMLNHLGGDMGMFVCQQRKQHPVQGFVNYIAGTNGFTLYDLFSYQEKHNEANGEQNLDGNGWNFSSNCGYEGRTGRRFVLDMRNRQIVNAVSILMLGQGVPLLLAGDEFCNSQSGNNNAYCQDNRIGWLNWKKGESFTWFSEVVAKLSEFRRSHPILTLEVPMQLRDYMKKGFPDLSYHGESAWVSPFSLNKQAVGLLYCGEYAVDEDGKPDDYIYVGYNFYNGIAHIALPKLPGRKKWHLVFDSARGKEPFVRQPAPLAGTQLHMKSQSVVILIGK